jgi:hypothetical protein
VNASEPKSLARRTILETSRARAVALGLVTALAMAVAVAVAAPPPPPPPVEGSRSADAQRYREKFKRSVIASNQGVAPAGLLQFLKGIDADFKPITDDNKAALNDPIAVLLFKRGTFPRSLTETLRALDAGNADTVNGVPGLKSYLIGEGGTIPSTADTKDLDRNFRFVVARTKGTDANVLVSANAPSSDGGFLQVIAWDPVAGVFNYYERLETATWAWRGNSNHALSAPTRGQGCFDCHVNGSLVMKELEFPWQNWHSMVAPIDSAVAQSSPLRADPLFLNKSGGEDLEASVVRPGIARWNDAKAAKFLKADGSVDRPKDLLKPLFQTTVNLGTSRSESLSGLDKPIRLQFFLNRDALFDRIGLDPPDDFRSPVVARDLYQLAIAPLGFELASGSFRQPGETHFAFLAPEPADEDLEVIDRLIRAKIISRKFAACVLMVDFPNPIFSTPRVKLRAYLPATAKVVGGASDLPEAFAKAVTTASAGLADSSPEKQFLAHWNQPDAGWEAAFEAQIKAYLDAVTPRLATLDGVTGYLKLGESRRREFAEVPLHEAFDLMLPNTNIPANAPTLEMKLDGSVGPR